MGWREWNPTHQTHMHEPRTPSLQSQPPVPSKCFCTFITATESRCRKTEKRLGSGSLSCSRRVSETPAQLLSPRDSGKGRGGAWSGGCPEITGGRRTLVGGLGGCCHFMSPRRRVRVSCGRRTAAGWAQGIRLSLTTRTPRLHRQPRWRRPQSLAHSNPHPLHP